MSDNTPGNTLGGLISSLLRSKTKADGTRGGLTGTHKALGGALLAAGAAYLYQRAKNKPTTSSNQ